MGLSSAKTVYFLTEKTKNETLVPKEDTFQQGLVIGVRAGRFDGQRVFATNYVMNALTKVDGNAVYDIPLELSRSLQVTRALTRKLDPKLPIEMIPYFSTDRKWLPRLELDVANQKAKELYGPSGFYSLEMALVGTFDGVEAFSWEPSRGEWDNAEIIVDSTNQRPEAAEAIANALSGIESPSVNLYEE